MADLDGARVDSGLAVEVLEAFVGELGLTAMDAVQVHETTSSLVAVLLLGESHASVHASGDAVFVDVFSCVAFDFERAEAIVRRLLRPACIAVRFVERPVSDGG